jgi:biopolymer transport protein ExbD
MPKKSIVRNEKADEINISPLIDMVFILLIFFIVTTVFIDERGFQADKPDAASEPQDSEIEPLIFTITDNNDVMFEGSDVGVSAVQRIFRNQPQDEDIPIIIKTEKGSRAGLAIRVRDELVLAGADVNLVNFASAQ